MTESETLIEELSTLRLKLDRLETILAVKSEDFMGGAQSIAEKAKALSLEVEELKELRESLKEELQQTLEKAVKEISPSLVNSLTRSFNEETKDFIDKHLNALQKIQYSTERSITDIQYLARDSKKRSILISISLILATGFGCFVMAAGLFYFYPRHYHVRYECGAKHVSQMIYGKILIDNFKNLTQNDQKLLLDSLEKILKNPVF